LGDVGGTNIRLQLVVFKLKDNFAYSEIKIERMKVKNFTTFTQAIEFFLFGIKK
jgi:glucokinase